VTQIPRFLRTASSCRARRALAALFSVRVRVRLPDSDDSAHLRADFRYPRILRFLVTINNDHYQRITTMASTISDYCSSAPPTSQLYAPTEVQRAGDFDSTVTTTSTENDSTTPLAYKDVDWHRLRGFELLPPIYKRLRA
jgi:hypothetical protein